MPDAGRPKFNELLYVQKFKKKAPPIRTQGDQWYVWDGNAWKLTSRDCFKPLALETLPPQHRLARHAKALMDHVDMGHQMGRDETLRGALHFDQEKRVVLINCENGVLRVDATGMKLLPHCEEYLFTGYLRAIWDEKAEASLFTKVLDDALPDAHDQALLQWFSGYLLYPNAEEHEVFLLCFGEGGTGKSTIANAIMRTIGGEPLVTALSMTQICGSGPAAYSLPKLQHAIVNMGTELDTVELDDSANFKRIVSGETIEARTIYGRPFPMKTTAKLWFLANSLPRFKHGTEAELRRARFLLFDKKPQEKDVTLKDRLAAESSGIFRWMIAGLHAVLCGMNCPEGGEKSRSVKEKFAVSNDPVIAFVKQRCVIDPKDETPKQEIYDDFMDFLDGWGFGEASKKFLFQSLYQRVPSLTPHRYYDGNQEKKPAGRYIRGLRLREVDEL